MESTTISWKTLVWALLAGLAIGISMNLARAGAEGAPGAGSDTDAIPIAADPAHGS